MRRAVPAGVAAALAALVAAFAPSSAAEPAPLALAPIVRITTPGVTACPAEGEPETTHTRLGTWVAYNDDHGCPLLPTATRFEEVQLVPGQGRPIFIPIPGKSGEVAVGDPDIAPAPDGGVYVSTLLETVPFTTPIFLRIMRIDPHLHVHVLPSPSFQGQGSFDDKEFIAVDNEPRSRFAGRVYVAWDDLSNAGTTVLRAWNGHRWERPVTLMKAPGEPDVAVGPRGEVAVAMHSGRGAEVRLSTDGGRHFGKPIIAIPGVSPGRVNPSCPLRPTVGVRQRAGMDARVAFDAAGDLHVMAAVGRSTDAAGKDVSGPAVVRHAVLRGAHVLHEEAVTPPTSDEQWNPALAAFPTGGVAVSWLQTNGPARDTYDAWIAVQRAGARSFASAQRLSQTSSNFPAVTEAVGNSNCYGIGDYIGMTSTPNGVATVWPTTDTDVPGVDSDVLLRTAKIR